MYVSTLEIALAVLSSLLDYSGQSEATNQNLNRVFIFFSNGESTPFGTYESDPYKNHDWPSGRGSLTNNGKLQMYELGVKYHRDYVDFLPEVYSDSHTYVQSSDASICLMSAYAFLAGMWPPTEKEMWHPEIPVQPIPVHSRPKELDYVVAATKPCKTYDVMYSTMLTEENQKIEYKALFDYLSKHTGATISSIVEVESLYRTLASQQEAGLTLPEWMKDEYPQRIKEIYMISLALQSNNTDLQRYKTGQLIFEIMIRMHPIDNGRKINCHLCIYSVHDVNMVSLYRALEFNELLAPEYGASIAIELYDHETRVLYRNNSKTEVPLELNLPYCVTTTCTVTEIRAHFNSVHTMPSLTEKWEEHCNN